MSGSASVRYRDDPKEYLRQWRQRNAERVRANARAYREANKPQTRERQNRWWTVKKERIEAEQAARNAEWIEKLARRLARDANISLPSARSRVMAIAASAARRTGSDQRSAFR